MRTFEERLRAGLKREIERAPKPELRGHVSRLEQTGLSLKESLYEAVRTAGTHAIVRGGAARVLLDAGRLDCIDILLGEFFRATDVVAIWEAAKSIECADAKRAVETLSRALYDLNHDRCQAAAYALGWLHDERAVVPLIRALEDAAQTEPVRCQCAEALGYLHSMRAIPALIRTLKDPSASVRFWSVFALGQLMQFQGNTARVRRIKTALESVLDDAAIPPSWWSVGQEALAALGSYWLRQSKGAIRRNPHGKRFHARLEEILRNPDASQEDQNWAECYKDYL